MKNINFKKYLILSALAIVLSVAIVRIHSVSNVPFCINAAGCTFQYEPKGQVVERQYGYPLTYKKTSTFRPQNNDSTQKNYAGYAGATIEQQRLSIINIVVNF